MAKVSDGQGGNPTDGQGGAVSDGTPELAQFDPRTAVFFAAEIDAYLPGAAPGGLEHGTTDTLRVSDLGYRTRASDPGGVQAYPPLLDTAFEIDRRLSLDPAQASTRSDGAIRLVNLRSAFDAFTALRNVDSRRLRILVGQKMLDPRRGVALDPAYSTLQPYFTGSCGAWTLGEDILEVSLKDTAYWTQRPLQSRQYGGTGRLDGGPALTGRPIPMTRGGTPDLPVLNVPLVLVDAVQRIWQWTDGPGQVVRLYEGGGEVFGRQGDVGDLYAGTTAPGFFRTCNAKGLLQLGSAAQLQITADVTGAFPIAGQVDTAVALAYAILTETLELPAEFADAAAFIGVDATLPYTAGLWDDGSTQGLAIVQELLASAGARLASARSGQLRPYVLRPLATGVGASRTLDPSNTISVVPSDLPAALDPPPYRWRVQYGRNYTPMASGLLGGLTEARQQALAQPSQTATWSDTDVQAIWLRPNDPAPLATYLLQARHARWVAEDHGAMWRGRPDHYSMVVPFDIAAGLDIGSVVRVVWPLGSLRNGALGQVVGEQVRSRDATVALEVLVSREAPQPGFLDLIGITGTPAAPQVNIIGVAP